MSSRVAGERRAPVREMKANASYSGGSKGTHPSRAGTRRRKRVQHPARDERVAEAAPGQLERGLHVLHLDLRLDGHACALGPLGELATGRVLGAVGRVWEDQRRAGQALDRHRAAHARGLRAGEDELVAHDRADVEALVVDRQDDDARLEAPGADLLGDLGRVEADEPHADLGVLAPEVRDDLRGGVVARRAEGAERGRAAAQAPDRHDGVARLLGGVEDLLGVGPQLERRVRGHEASPDAVEQGHAELGLELADLLGERRLGHAQALGGLAERARVERREEVLQLLQRQGFTLRFQKDIKAIGQGTRVLSWRHALIHHPHRRLQRRRGGGPSLGRRLAPLRRPPELVVP
jgi:hypothetical protein